MAIALLMSACGKSEHPSALTPMVVDRQVLFRDIKIQPNAITRLSDGRFVIAGTGTIARAFVTDAQGTLLWQYTDVETEGEAGYQSAFYGAVPLSTGSILFCGSTNPTGHSEINEITILDGSGGVVERRAEIPNGDRTLTSSGFVKCFPWNDGIVLAGYASDGTRGYTWTLKLDSGGKKLWETLVQGTTMTEIAVPSAASIVFATPGRSNEEKISVFRVAPQGAIVAKRVISGHRFVQLRNVEPSNRTQIISYALGGAATLYTFDENLRDAEPPKNIGDFDATQGCGYALPDNSLVLFGRKNNAAIARISEPGFPPVIDEFSAKYKSFVIAQAVALSGNRFVTVRYSASVNPSDNGLVMAWVSF